MYGSILGIMLLRRGRNISLFHIFRPGLGYALPLVPWIPWTLTRRVIQPGLEAGHSPPSHAEVYKYVRTPQYGFNDATPNQAKGKLRFWPYHASGG